MEIANLWRTPGATKSHVEVPNTGDIPAAEGTAGVPLIVAPRAATQHTLLAGIRTGRILGWRLAVIV